MFLVLNSAVKTIGKKVLSRNTFVAVRSVTTLQETLEAQIPKKQKKLFQLKKERHWDKVTSSTTALCRSFGSSRVLFLSSSSDVTDFKASSVESSLVAEEPETTSEEDEASPSPVVAAEDATAPKDAATEKNEEWFRVYIGNLPTEPPEYDEERIKQLFEPTYGTVTEITVPLDRFTGNPRGFAFVTLESEEAARKAIAELHETEIEGRLITVSEHKSEKELRILKLEETKLFIGNISFDTTKDDLLTFFNQYTFVRDLYIPLDRGTGESRGFAFITIDKNDAENVIEQTDQVEFDGRTIRVNKSLPKGEAPPNRRNAPREPRSNQVRLYVGNLSFDTTKETIEELFEEYGEIKACYMPFDRETKRSRGFAFITMEAETALQAADEKDGFELDGRIIRVNEAQPKE